MRRKEIMHEIITEDGIRMKNKKESIQAIIDYHFTTEEATPNILVKTTTQNFKKITYREIKASLNNLSNNKAPGPDGINKEIIDLLFRNCPKTFIELFNARLKNGHFLTNWKYAEIVLFSKPNKDLNINSYRPTSLLSAWGKLIKYSQEGSITTLRLQIIITNCNTDSERIGQHYRLWKVSKNS